MSITDEQIYEASKEILLKFLGEVDTWSIYKDLVGYSKEAARCAKLMADAIDRDNLKPEFKRVDNEDR